MIKNVIIVALLYVAYMSVINKSSIVNQVDVKESTVKVIANSLIEPAVTIYHGFYATIAGMPESTYTNYKYAYAAQIDCTDYG